MSSRLAWMAAFTLEVNSTVSFRYFWFSFSSSVTFAFTMAIDSFIFGIWSFRSRMFCSRISSGSSAAEIIQPNMDRKARFIRCHIGEPPPGVGESNHSLGMLATMLYGCAEPGSVFPEWGPRPLEVEIGPGPGGVALHPARLPPESELGPILTPRSDWRLIPHRRRNAGLRH